MPFVIVAALSCSTICVALLGYADNAPSLDSAHCRCIDLVDKQEGLPIPLTLTLPKPKKAQPEQYDDRPALPAYGGD